MLTPWLFVQAFLVPVVFPDRQRARVRGTYVVGYFVGVVLVALVLPVLLIPIAIVAVAATVVGIWLGRRHAGSARGLPPGSVPAVNLRSIVDREYFSKQAARNGPVFKSISPTMPDLTVCIVGLPRALSFLRANDERLAPVKQNPFDELIPGRLLRHMRGDAHKHYRRILHDAFDDDVLERCRPEIDAILRDGLAELSAASLRDPARGVSPRTHIEQDVILPAFLRLFFGLSPGASVARRASQLLLNIQQDMVRNDPRIPTYATYAAELDAIVRAEGVEIAAQLGAGIAPAPSFLAALLTAHPDALDDAVVLRNLIFNLRVGLTDLTGLLHWTLKLLCDNPEWLSAVGAADDSRDLAERIVKETLRLQQSDLLHRRATEDLEVDGYAVPSGSLVRICVHESHRDPAVFEDPSRFNPDRFTHPFSRSEYSPLGVLAHACLGANLTHAVDSVFVQRLANDYDVSVISDGRPILRTSWRVSPRHRVVLRPRA